ncbi:hypothetical protein IGI37_000144 [Enterococcus sp. AZ194]
MDISTDVSSTNNVEIDVNVLLELLKNQTETIDSLKKTNQALTTEIQLLNEKLNYFMNRQFGRSKETISSDVSGQLNLFTEELEEASIFTVPKEEKPAPEKKSKRKSGQKAEKIAHLPLTEIHHELPQEERSCEHCGTQMIDIGTTKLREEVRFHQAMLDRLAHIQHTYCCKACEKADVSSYKKAPVPKPVVPNSLGSNSIIAETIRLKFGQKSPANRQEIYWRETLGLDISRDNMTNWHIKACHHALDPVAERFKHYLNQEEILHADETSYQVIQSKKAKTYYWLFSTGKHSAQPIAYYHHAESKSGTVPKEFLSDFKGYLHCDGYAGYNYVTDVKLVYCLAHARRKFFEAIPKNSKAEQTPAVVAVKMLDIWFELERKWKEVTIEERFDKRQGYLKPLVNNFYEWLDTFVAVPKSKLENAVEYVRKIRSGFERIFEDGRLELSNNLAERHIKELVIGRKNYMHSCSLEGARTSGVILSIYRTAVANGLDPIRYIEFLFDRVPNMETQSDEGLDALLPWKPDVQALCRTTYKQTK